ncbi:hypothetical protein PRIPAC_71448 [Pristionchus pacificus]|uniref:G protein-coupled receptor n=1 Tax=Pristionchus pacificus TaxID=54126 RepID=A0A2A6C1G9_PRIPA|nr:hypothetical protein PRIPAC_71448 [Pristionchus pacificus]|eukprot:PDM71958.1 G protein-coupled receptor [Pristionchus pacificus]
MITMTFYLVMVNLTLASGFSPLFESVYAIETLICLGILVAIPLAIYTVMGMSPLHRNMTMPFSWSLTWPCALAWERCFATLFSSWYEKQSASSILIFIMQSLSLEMYAWGNAFFLVYDVYCFQFNVVSYAVLFIFGAALFQYILTLNVAYNRKLQQMTRNEYCLSRSYQIRENIRIMQMIRKLAFPTVIFNIPAFGFISLYAFLPNEERLDVVRNVAVAFFDLWIALYAAAFGLLTYNLEPKLQESVRRLSYAAYILDRYDDVTGKIRKLTMRSPPPPQHSETDIYFSMLSKDLHSNENRKYSNISKLSIIEI